LHHSANNEKYNTPKLILFVHFMGNSGKQKQNITINNVKLQFPNWKTFAFVKKYKPLIIGNLIFILENFSTFRHFPFEIFVLFKMIV